MSTLGERLRQIRLEKGWSLYDVEKFTGIGFSLLSKYERGERIPSQERLKFFADFYDVSIDWLLGRTNKRNMVDTVIVSEPAQEYLQDIVKTLPNVPQENLPLVANLIKTLAAHGGEIKNKQAVMRYVERKRREAEAKRRKQKDDETSN